jgi:hypothetical protein
LVVTLTANIIETFLHGTASVHDAALGLGHVLIDGHDRTAVPAQKFL